MEQHRMNDHFNTELGQQLSVLYTTSDDRVFIRYTEAHLHRLGSLDANTVPLKDQTITEWYPEH